MVRNLVSYFLVVALGIIFLLHMALLYFYGSIVIYEDSLAVRSIEVAMATGIIVLGIERIVHWIETNCC